MGSGMNRKQLLLSLLLVDFVALSAWAIAQSTWAGFVELMQQPMMIQAAADLVIALLIACALMWRDAKQRGINPLPYVIATCCTGSPGILAYMIKRSADPVAQPALAAA